MDIALRWKKCFPGSQYGGCFVENTREEYEAIEWEDERGKPTWDELAGYLPPLNVVKARKLAELTRARWEHENGWIDTAGWDRHQDGSRVSSTSDGRSFCGNHRHETPIEWKGANGWVVLTPQQVLQIATLVRQHVQAAFSKERELSERVRACPTQEELGKITWVEKRKWKAVRKGGLLRFQKSEEVSYPRSEVMVACRRRSQSLKG